MDSRPVSSGESGKAAAPATGIPFPRTLGEAARQFFGDGASAHPAVQFFKYAFAGGLATLVHVISFSVFAWKVFPCVGPDDLVVRLFSLEAPAIDEALRARLATQSNACAWVLSNCFCYALNRVFVFKPGRLNPWAEFLAFSAVGGFSTAVGTSVMAWLVASLGLQTSVAFVANLVSSLAFNYVLRKFFIFRG